MTFTTLKRQRLGDGPTQSAHGQSGRGGADAEGGEVVLPDFGMVQTRG